MIDNSTEVCDDSPMNGLRVELTRINKRHQAKLLGLWETKRILDEELRSDLVRSYNFLLEDTVDALNVLRMETNNGSRTNQPSNKLGC